MESSRSASVLRAGAASSPSSASSPRPSPFAFAMAVPLCRLFLTIQHLAGEREIRLRALRRPVELERRHAVAGRFREPDIARDHGAIHLVAEMLEELGRHL